ncbi:hypothetical protein KIN20_006036 [Parelaphostrongylus tenuis]|uniref:Protein kinase domain-containing protein n=1 Tax=Parelaphostrongylus tenuis TaxID=148309 RepID=A0AAD5QFL3_PARTN|nr:hypothetical protein KIN20_006036 [Parelaphostrongylus tenuis]
MKNLFRTSTVEESRRSLPSIIEVNVNPKDFWEIVGELGDGAFAKVEKAVSKTDRTLFAAAKAIEVQEGEQLEDFLVEIDILTSCKHRNIVKLYACFFFENKLHVSPMRGLFKVQKSAPPTLDNPACWSLFFSDFLAQCLVKNPAERETAKQILSHPFIANATDRRLFLPEVNADSLEEEVIEDDRAS